MIHQRALVLAILALGCATPNKYQPGPDGGDVAPTDGMPSLPDISATVAPDTAGQAEVAAGGSADLSSDVVSAIDVPADLQVPRDVAADTSGAPADMLSLMANGETCTAGSACKSGNCSDGICCAQ